MEKGGSSGMSLSSVAIRLRNLELERKLMEIERKAGSQSGMSSSSVAIQLRNQELERKLAEMERSGVSSSLSPASVAIQQKNLELERKLAEMERKGGSLSMSPASVAIQQKNEELKRRLAEMEGNGASSGISPASVAIQQKNRELEPRLAVIERKGGSRPGSIGTAIELENQQLERRVAEFERGKSRVMSSASVAVHEKNRELERKLAELERNTTSSGRVMSSSSLAIMKKNEELERKFIGLSTKHNTTTLSPARQEKVNERVIKLKKLITASQELDLAFVVDVTGSMQPFIDSVKEKAPSIAAGVKKAWPQLKLRVAFAPYRDYEDSTRDDAEMCDFTNDFAIRDSIFVRALSRVRAEGGKDLVEDVFSGLERVATLSWKSRTRVLVHIGDAPCHGADFHDFGSDRGLDRCPEGDLRNRNISTLLKTLRDDRQIICYLFCHVNDSTKKMLSVFKKNCDDVNWIHEEKLSNINKLVDIVVNVATASIAQSVQVGDSKNLVRKFVKVLVKPEMPIWHNVNRERATQIRYKLPESLEDLFRALATNGKLEMKDMPDSTVQIAPFPFSGDGSLRWPYHALVHQPPSAPRNMVVKRFKATLGEDVNLIHAKEAYFEQMEVQTVAAKMAEEFNKVLESQLIEEYKTVEFTLVSTLRVGSKFYNLEKFLEGNWIRYSNNLNYVNTKEYAATLHAFSHWTYHRSKGLLVVNDLQGVEIDGTNGSKVFWLCDPAVHCKDALRYERTRTNWSEPGMRRFLEAHQCNYICRILRLAPTNRSHTST